MSAPRTPAPLTAASSAREGRWLVDLRLTAASPATDDERAAVASVLGPPESGWDGGERAAADAHAAYGGRAARPGATCCSPVLHAVQDRIGWISPERSITSAPGSPSRRPRRTASRRSTRCSAPRPRPARSSTSATTWPAGSTARSSCARRWTAGSGPRAPRRAANGTGVTWQRCPCLGQCDRGSAAMIQRAGAQPPVRCYRLWTPARCGRHCPPRRPPYRAVRWSRRPTATRSSLRLAAPRRPGRPGLARLLPGGGRVRDAPPRRGGRAAGRDPRTEGRQAARPRRRGVPDRGEVGGGRRQPGPAALRRLQRRRVRAGHLQGPGADGAATRTPCSRRSRSWATPAARSRATSTSAASTRRRRRGCGTPSARPASAASSAATSWARASPSTSRCGAAPAPTSPARRPR